MSTVIASVIVKYVLYAAVLAAIGIGGPFVKRCYAVLLAKVPAAYRPILETWADEAVRYVEQYVTTGGGETKFAAAVQHVIAIASHNKLSVSLQEIQGVIQAAYDRAVQANTLIPPKTATKTVEQPKTEEVAANA